MSDWDHFSQLREVLEAGREAELHRGAQFYLSQNGETLLDEAWGEQDAEQNLSNDHLMLWLSSGKPLTAVALGVLHDRGLLQWDDCLSRFLPEWAMFGQPEVTLRHLLTHTAGFENGELPWPEENWEDIISETIHSPLPDKWAVGEEARYVVAASWFLLGEVVARLTNRDFSSALRELVLDPLELPDTFCGLPEREYDSVKDRLGKMYERSKTGLTELEWNDPRRVTSASPGGNTRGPVRELGRFYESMLPESETCLLKPQTRQAMTTPQRVGLADQTFGHQLDWGLGFIVNSNRYGAETVPYGFGASASDASFGHGGSQSSMGFADPAHRLVVAWVVNGRPGEPRHHSRNKTINEAVYRDLGIAAE
jgi:CubicO group peptidase (beta-lactamase class C family)